MDPYLLCGVFAVLCSLFFLQRRLSANSRRPLPPGPPAYIPWIRHAFQIPTERQWVKFNEWSRTYGKHHCLTVYIGDIMSVEALGQRYIILGSLKACTDLFDRRSSNFSDRPRLPMLNELSGGNWSFAFREYGSQWRDERRAFHKYMNITQVAQYRPKQLKEARAFLQRLLATPDRFYDLVRHTLGATIMNVVYAIETAEENDEYINKAEEALQTLSLAGNPTAYLVNTFPWLKYIPNWFPGAQFKRQAARWRQIAYEFVTNPLNHVKEEMRRGTARPSMALSLLEELADVPQEERAQRERIVANVAAIAYGGGADTTISALNTFFLAMAMHPGVVKRAREELDSAVGTQRLPTFEDEEHLPYITAICKEVMRWQTVTPLAVVHSSVQDDEYNGYFLPKGSVFFGNAWAIMHDPEVYPEPHSFKPERFLKAGRINPEVRDPTVAAFGFGRRICPGRWFSAQSLFITVASVLAAYDIRAPMDEHGRPIQLEAKMTTGVLSYPEPFQCIIVPRSKQAERLVREGAIEVE
ncbi:cytochrome P450 [Punctularia strigosozonata HHB-11173 SS5]|uniref:cytochrome P450 n=1 Tax=Punctularia strigosozonata (strain HHB-11173) TaxID=741275 RepID=UPI000441805C|nr:cytochrome P450 [Punctularia strigosozonata HHB-11173 SS5]EIN05557.1 cytochrome P450 [Punctularia strigosozonata HHB-11173 SS5]